MLRLSCVLFLICFFDWSNMQGHYRKDRMPKIMGDKIPLSALMPEKPRTRSKIVKMHNVFRSRVKPAASNMLKMTWNERLAEAAQKWTQNCQFLTHDGNDGRFIPNYGPCGQNIFVATQKVPWFFAINTWFLEKDNFTYGGKNDLRRIGHYTQMVWAATHEVGCGISKCINLNNGTWVKYYSYICNYCPIGNLPDKLGLPYKKGVPCQACKGSCHSKRLCTNSCNVADYWSNCNRLFQRWPSWLCHTNTKKGKERTRRCRATCTCRQKIHD
ncbi:cysteine-rich venom protein LEI1-like [Harmonia axyridis]|uniref:cysteine-rich venom protein LEI1-like n=1 Tax=Harmonia axyridis TaxID=115357 RepID=UPI001E27800A|nr:cysteine-rich venom protein LEI1-like [Harmonia axyridis]